MGFLLLLGALLSQLPAEARHVGVELGLVRELFQNFLFPSARPGSGAEGIASEESGGKVASTSADSEAREAVESDCRCHSDGSRTAAFRLLTQLVTQDAANMADLLSAGLPQLLQRVPKVEGYK